jgi:hypothetical protein
VQEHFFKSPGSFSEIDDLYKQGWKEAGLFQWFGERPSTCNLILYAIDCFGECDIAERVSGNPKAFEDGKAGRRERAERSCESRDSDISQERSHKR